jgi:hypothetical protein
MNLGRANGNPTSEHTTPKPSVQELTELVRELYELLQGYAPWWSTKSMDTRVSDTLARFTPPRRFPQACLKVSGQASLPLLEKKSAASIPKQVKL